MAKGTRKRHSAQFKAKIALEAIQGIKTANEIGQAHGVHPTLVHQWKRELQEQAGNVFEKKHGKKKRQSTMTLINSTARLVA